MIEDIKLNDIADDLLILNKTTIDTLFRLENCADCIALYVFYYKTAKWQKTNSIKANDNYVKKSLKWGIDKIRKTKNILKEHGLINIIQRRKDGKIEGWYVEVAYLVSKRKMEDIKIKVENSNNTQIQQVEATTPESNNTQIQQVENPTSRNEEVNTLKEYIKSLKKEIEVLKKNNINNSPAKAEQNIPFKEIVDYLNMRIGSSYKHTTSKTKDLIRARFNEGFNLDDFKVVIDKKCVEWINNKEMSQYLRPETLFGNKFEGYLNQVVQQKKITTKDLTIDISDF